MPQVINETSLGGNIGTGFGSGLSQGLQSLVQNLIANKQQQQQRQSTISGLQALFPNLNPQQAQSLSNLDTSTINQFLKQQQQEQAGKNELNTLIHFLSGGQTPERPEAGPNFGANIENLPAGASIRPGNALNIAKYLQDQQRYAEETSRKKRQFEVSTLEPRFNELQNRYNQLNNQMATYKELRKLNKTGKVKSGIFGSERMLPAESQLFNALVESLVPQGATQAQIESVRKSLPNINQSKEVMAKLIDDNIKRLDKELRQVANEAKNLNYREFQTPELNLPTIEDINNIPQQENNIQQPIEESNENQEAQSSQESRGLPQALGYIGSRALKGGLEGITSIATAPFSIANLLSLGNIPVPETVKQIQNLPDKTLEAIGANIQPGSEGEKWFGDFIEDLTSFLTPGGILGSASKIANLPRLQTAAKILGNSPKSAATVSAVGNFAKWAASKLGGTESEGNIAKAGAQLLVPILGSRLAGYKVQSLGNDIKNSIKPTDTIKSPSLVGENINLYNVLTKETKSSLKDQALKAITPLFNQKEPATMSLSDVWNAKQILSQPNISNLKGVKNYLAHLDKALEPIYKSNPQFAQAVSEFTDLSNALKTTNTVYNFVNKHIPRKHIKNPITYALLGSATKLGWSRPKATLGLLGASLPLNEITRVIQMSIKSPAFRKYYGNFISNAVAGNVKEAQTAIKNLDKTITHEENKLD